MALQEELIAALAPDRVSTGADELTRHGTDEGWHEPAAPDFVVYPRSNEEALRAAVAAGAASTLEVGAGKFDPKHAGRLQAGVELAELAPVEA